MNISIISILLPYPLNSGGAQGVYNMVDKLRHHHNVSFIFPMNVHNRPEALAELRKRWPEVHFYPYAYSRQLANPLYFIDKVRRGFGLKFQSKNRGFCVSRILKHYGYPNDKSFLNFLENIFEKEQPDLIQTEFYPFLRLINSIKFKAKKVFVHHEIRFIRNERALAEFTLTPREQSWMRQLKEEEISDLNKYDLVLALTEIDKKILEDNGVSTNIGVSPLAVNTEPLQFTQWNGRIVFVGGFSHTPNQEGLEWFTKRVTPLIDWKKYGDKLSLDIVGSGWKESFFKDASPNLKVRCLGFVENLANAAHGSIMIVPILSGSGMRMKILEAAALECPFVSTSVGCEGIGVVTGQECLIADTPEDFARELERLMDSTSLQQKLAKNAKLLYEKEYSVEALAQKREMAYKEIMSSTDNGTTFAELLTT